MQKLVSDVRLSEPKGLSRLADLLGGPVVNGTLDEQNVKLPEHLVSKITRQCPLVDL